MFGQVGNGGVGGNPYQLYSLAVLKDSDPFYTKAAAAVLVVMMITMRMKIPMMVIMMTILLMMIMVVSKTLNLEHKINENNYHTIHLPN